MPPGAAADTIAAWRNRGEEMAAREVEMQRMRNDG
jgi:hypothetical protein